MVDNNLHMSLSLKNVQKVILILILGWFSVVVYGQQQELGFPGLNLSRRMAMTEIERQTGFHFAINHSAFDDSERIVFSRQTLSLAEALNQLLAGTKHTFRINGKQILILPKDKSESVWESTDNKQVKPPVRVNRQTSGQRNYGNTSIYYRDREFEWALNEYQRKEHPAFIPDTIRKKSEKKVVTRRTDTLSRTKFTPYAATSLPLINNGVYEPYKKMGLNRIPSKFAVKTNLLYDFVALTPNLAVEFGLSCKMSLDLSVSWNPFNSDGVGEKNRKFLHLLIKPEIRYWFCQRFNGHFVGIHPFYLHYNVCDRKVPLLFDKEFRYEGNGFGGGISYGYHFLLGKHWGLELNAGVGFALLNYEKYERPKCSDKLGDYDKKYFGPTSLGIKIMYILK